MRHLTAFTFCLSWTAVAGNNSFLETQRVFCTVIERVVYLECSFSVPDIDISRQSAREGGNVVSPAHRPPLPKGRFLVLTFARGWVDPTAPSAAEKLKSMTPIRNQTRDLPSCSAVPQPTAHRVSHIIHIHSVYTRWFKYDRDKLWLVYTQIVPVIFEPPCIIRYYIRVYKRMYLHTPAVEAAALTVLMICLWSGRNYSQLSHLLQMTHN